MRYLFLLALLFACYTTPADDDDTLPDDDTTDNGDDDSAGDDDTTVVDDDSSPVDDDTVDDDTSDDDDTTSDECADAANLCGQNLTVRLREDWGAGIPTQNVSSGYNWSDPSEVAEGIAAGYYPPVPSWPDVSVYPDAYNDATVILNDDYGWDWCCSVLDWPADYHAPDMVTIHHTAGAFGTCDEYVEWVYNFHTFGQYHGWGDVGYQLLVCEDSPGVVTLYEGRYSGSISPTRNPFSSIWVIGAHVAGYNTGNVGISLVGDFSTVAPDADEFETIQRVAARVYYELGLTDTTELYGHRDLGSTECPGNMLYNQLDAVRDRINWCQNTCGIWPKARMTAPVSGPFVTESSKEGFGD